MRFYVQETIGGWKQTPVFEGSYKECLEFYEEVFHSGSFAVVSEEELEVDYL